MKPLFKIGDCQVFVPLPACSMIEVILYIEIRFIISSEQDPAIRVFSVENSPFSSKRLQDFHFLRSKYEKVKANTDNMKVNLLCIFQFGSKHSVHHSFTLGTNAI